MNTMTTTLAKKIAAASKAVGSLTADKRNMQQNYDYISADKILERAGNALADQGVTIFPAIISEDTRQIDYTDGYGKAKTRLSSTRSDSKPAVKVIGITATDTGTG